MMYIKYTTRIITLCVCVCVCVCIEVRGDRCQTALYDVITRVHNG